MMQWGFKTDNVI